MSGRASHNLPFVQDPAWDHEDEKNWPEDIGEDLDNDDSEQVAGRYESEDDKGAGVLNECLEAEQSRDDVRR